MPLGASLQQEINKEEKEQIGGVQWPVPSLQRLYGWLEEGVVGGGGENAPFNLQGQFIWQT